MKIKKKCIILILIVLVVVVYLQYGRDVTIHSNVSNSFDKGTIEYVTIIANRIYILNEEEFAEKVIQRCVDNAYKEIQFSYDVNGYPVGVHITVYLNEIAFDLSRPALEINYTQEFPYKYNIKENPEKFDLEIIEK